MSSGALGLATPQEISKYEPVIGLEVHVQTEYANKNVLRQPDQLWRPSEHQRLSGLSGTSRRIADAQPASGRTGDPGGARDALPSQSSSRFARKNYFYPDLPKGYQITQLDEPLAAHGWVETAIEGNKGRIGLTRIQLEEDAGKSIHDGFQDFEGYTYVDLNRSGTPLIEIVSEPDLRSPGEAYAFLTELKLVLQYVGVSECDMEKGQLRCDANVSVRLRGAEKFGTKAEVENLNSFRFAKLALDYEIARQVPELMKFVLDSGRGEPT